MKLLKKYRIYTYTSLVFAIIIGFVSNYHLYKLVHVRTADEVIIEYKKDIEDYAVEHKTLKPLMAANSKFGQIFSADSSYHINSIDQSIKDTLAYDAYQDEVIIFRKIKFPIKAEDGLYIVQLMLPTLEQDFLIGTIIISLLFFTIIFVAFTSVIDILFTRNIFRPFRNIISQINTYNIENKSELKIDKSDIDEFEDLSNKLTRMVTKINNGYYEMKDFLEYTSHEIKTPLSVIELKLETLNQKNFEDEEVLKAISSIHTSLRKVIHFNRYILVIAKIKNGQYDIRKTINLRVLLNNYIKQYDELISLKNIKCKIKNIDDFKVTINPMLAEHLIQNILTNAIKHNVYGGDVEIISDKNQLKVSNTFDGLLPEGDLFEKYNHMKGKNNCSGIGLAMVKTICQHNDIKVTYQITQKKFIIILMVNKSV